MAETAKNIKPADMLKKLSAEGLIDKNSTEAAKQILTQGKPTLPSILQIFSGLGAFISAIPFLFFLGISEIINFSSEISLLIWGLIFISGAIPIGRANKDRESLLNIYLQQISLIFMGTGKILVIWGGVELLPFSELWNIVIILFILTAGTYQYFGSSVDRFLSALIALISVQIAIATEIRGDLYIQELWLTLYFIAQVLFVQFLSTGNRRKAMLVPLYYAGIFSLANIVLLLSASSVVSETFGLTIAYNVYIIGGSLAGIFLYLIYQASNRFNSLNSGQLPLIVTGLVILALLPAPGVLFALVLLFLGYKDFNKNITIIGLGFLAYFIINYYYNLDFSLLIKSLILMGSGLLLLSGHMIMQFKKWHSG